MDDSFYISQTRRWIEKVVVGLNLCPFAVQPFQNNKIHIKVNSEDQSSPIINDVLEESLHLSASTKYETSFIITPNIRLGFEAYYDFVSDIQDLIQSAYNVSMMLIVFHPEFRYANSDYDDTGNATNRSPFPMIHLLKQSSLDEVSTSNYDIGAMLEKNRILLGDMSWDEIRSLYH